MHIIHKGASQNLFSIGLTNIALNNSYHETGIIGFSPPIERCTIDLSNTLSNEINKQLTLKNTLLRNILNKNEDNSNINSEIKNNLSNLHNFRKKGTINNSDIKTYNLNNINNQNMNKNLNKDNQFKFRNKFEKVRFIKALKHIMTERLGERNIIIPNICSCGQLQKKLDFIVEKGNISVLTNTNLNCANNCIYYNNQKEYNRCINEVLDSIKKITYEAFHNKYK